MNPMKSQGKKLNLILWSLMALESLTAALFTLRYPSEAASAFLFGYSKQVLLVAALLFGSMMMFLFAAVNSQTQTKIWQRLAGMVNRFFSSPVRTFLIIAPGLVLLLGILTLQILSLSQAANEAVILKSLTQRFGVLLICIELILIELLILFHLNLKAAFQYVIQPVFLSLLFALASGVYLLGIKLYAQWMWLTQFRGMEDYIFFPAVVFLVWALLYQYCRAQSWYARISSFFLSLAIFAVTYTLYRQTAQWVNWYNTPSKTYWHELADAFNQGRLYLLNPASNHDLTFFNNHWYVPNPPLPALILMPIAAVLGVEHINMVTFSIICASLTVVLIFWLLQSASQQGLIPTQKRENLWLTALFAFGTCFWWLAVMARMWFLSQTFTVLFTALAAYWVVRKKSPWLAGAALGLAILARPNVFALWPFLLGIALFYENQSEGRIRWKEMVSWAVQSAIPVVLAVAGLLFYNYLRFGNFMDFGYVSINSAEWIMNSVKTYGMFNPHFIPSNFAMMFLNHPTLQCLDDCIVIHASRDGYNLLVMTPALIYVLRRWQKNWWMLGAGVSILLSMGLLLLYHNNGAWQLGYRYLMDFIVPVLLVIAVGVGKKMSLVFKGLLGLSLLSNGLGILWWFNLLGCG